MVPLLPTAHTCAPSLLPKMDPSAFVVPLLCASQCCRLRRVVQDSPVESYRPPLRPIAAAENGIEAHRRAAALRLPSLAAVRSVQDSALVSYRPARSPRGPSNARRSGLGRRFRRSRARSNIRRSGLGRRFRPSPCPLQHSTLRIGLPVPALPCPLQHSTLRFGPPVSSGVGRRFLRSSARSNTRRWGLGRRLLGSHSLFS